ncbi:hypothetical protein PCE1_003342 [Barthelona sp. PCE]
MKPKDNLGLGCRPFEPQKEKTVFVPPLRTNRIIFPSEHVIINEQRPHTQRTGKRIVRNENNVPLSARTGVYVPFTPKKRVLIHQGLCSNSESRDSPFC